MNQVTNWTIEAIRDIMARTKDILDQQNTTKQEIEDLLVKVAALEMSNQDSDSALREELALLNQILQRSKISIQVAVEEGNVTFPNELYQIISAKEEQHTIDELPITEEKFAEEILSAGIKEVMQNPGRVFDSFADLVSVRFNLDRLTPLLTRKGIQSKAPLRVDTYPSSIEDNSLSFRAIYKTYQQLCQHRESNNGNEKIASLYHRLGLSNSGQWQFLQKIVDQVNLLGYEKYNR